VTTLHTSNSFATWEQLHTKLFSERDADFCDLVLLTYRNFGQTPHQLLGVLCHEFDLSLAPDDLISDSSNAQESSSSSSAGGGASEGGRTSSSSNTHNSQRPASSSAESEPSSDRTRGNGRLPSILKRPSKNGRDRQKRVEFVLRRWLKLATDFIVDPTLFHSLADVGIERRTTCFLFLGFSGNREFSLPVEVCVWCLFFALVYGMLLTCVCMV
jgi:hypothetical protein